MRDKGMLVQSRTNERAANATAFNPTEHDLQEFATIYLNNPTSMPMYCRGNVSKNWTPPEGVMFMFQVGLGQDTYYMMCSQQHIEKVEQEDAAYREAHPVRPTNNTEKLDAIAILDRAFRKPTNDNNIPHEATTGNGLVPPFGQAVTPPPATAEERARALEEELGATEED